MAGTLSRSGLAAVHDTAARLVGDDKTPGLVALVASGHQVHVEALGSLTIGGPPVVRDSLFRIASMTKPVTGAATMALIEEGLISLDETVDRLLPELASRRVLRTVTGPLDDTVAAIRPITVRDLLTFTFGFGFVMELFTEPGPLPIVLAEQAAKLATFGPPDRKMQPDGDTWLAGLGSLPLLAQPGERWMYNTGASVLGVLLTRAAGMPLRDVFRTRLLDPLGMTQTAFWTTEPARLATAYRPASGGLEMWDPPDGDYSRAPAFEDGAGGLVSTVDDLLAFARLFLRGGDPVLSADSITAMTTDQLTPQQKARGGLGTDFFSGMSWSFCQAVQDDGVFGWDGGFGSTWMVDPARELVIVILTQRMFDGPGLPDSHAAIRKAAYAALE